MLVPAANLAFEEAGRAAEVAEPDLVRCDPVQFDQRVDQALADASGRHTVESPHGVRLIEHPTVHIGHEVERRAEHGRVLAQRDGVAAPARSCRPGR